PDQSVLARRVAFTPAEFGRGRALADPPTTNLVGGAADGGAARGHAQPRRIAPALTQKTPSPLRPVPDAPTPLGTPGDPLAEFGAVVRSGSAVAGQPHQQPAGGAPRKTAHHPTARESSSQRFGDIIEAVAIHSTHLHKYGAGDVGAPHAAATPYVVPWESA